MGKRVRISVKHRPALVGDLLAQTSLQPTPKTLQKNSPNCLHTKNIYTCTVGPKATLTHRPKNVNLTSVRAAAIKICPTRSMDWLNSAATWKNS